MKTRQWITTGGLLVLVALAFIGLVLTGGSSAPVDLRKKPEARSNQQNTLVDQRPLETARKLAALASTVDEQRIAQETLRLSDHEVDLAFADALREAQEHPVQLTPETRELSKHVNQTEATVKADKDRIHLLTKSLAAANEADKEHIQQLLELAQAQLTLDQDELDDAKQDLTRAGGDPESNIRRLIDQHEATQHASDSHAAPAAPNIDYTAGNLSAQVRAWTTLRGKSGLLGQARQEALRDVPLLTARHQAFEQHVAQEASERQAISQQVAGVMASGPASATNKVSTASTLSSFHHFSADQKALSDLDKRIQDEQELADAYGSWLALVESHQRMALHRIIQSSLWILLVVLTVYLAARMIDRYFTELSPGKSRLHTMRVVVRFAVQAVGVVLILFVVFGAPSQTPTILGLAGAGLTVALKDFIVAFFGWFVLMGKNGIRVGDWVEINGVGGEVVEIGLLRTVLLETGNWTDSGHPTGRRVAFVNSYAVEGHYFNFSTSGQWLWDEIRLLIPAGQNPYPIIDSIQKLVTAETEGNVRTAEQEWQHATSRYRVKSFSAIPSLDVRPTPSGVEIVVRYIARAHERYDMRARLYSKLVDLLHGKRTPESAASLPAGFTQ